MTTTEAPRSYVVQNIAETPTTVPEIRRFMGMVNQLFMGMVNQLGKFSPNLAQLTEPLQELLSKIRAWQWGPEQQKAFLLVKTKLSKLSLYDPQRDHTISADVSSYGLGAVFQIDKSEYLPVAFASRSMMETVPLWLLLLVQPVAQGHE